MYPLFESEIQLHVVNICLSIGSALYLAPVKSYTVNTDIVRSLERSFTFIIIAQPVDEKDLSMGSLSMEASQIPLSTLTGVRKRPNSSLTSCGRLTHPPLN
jgi:hypothetical protein